jgi:hypothetical protein
VPFFSIIERIESSWLSNLPFVVETLLLGPETFYESVNIVVFSSLFG